MERGVTAEWVYSEKYIFMHFKYITAWAEVWANNLYKVCIEKEKEISVADETIKQNEIENSVAEHRAWFSEFVSQSLLQLGKYDIFHLQKKLTQEIPWSGKKASHFLRTNHGS